MTETRLRPVTERQAESVRKAVEKRFKPWVTETNKPVLMMDFDPGYAGVDPFPAVVWESGPFEWATKDPAGDIDEEFGGVIKAMPLYSKRVRTEPWNSFVLAVYKAGS